MDRVKFCEALVKARESVNYGKNELCRRTGFTFVQLQRLESAYNNFKIDLVFRYLGGIDRCLCFTNSDQCLKIESYDALYNLIVDWRKNSQYSIAQISELTGFSGGSISNIENKRQTITIDYLISICNLFNYTITFK